MNQAIDTATALMDAVERLEQPLLAWGVTEVGVPWHEVRRLAADLVGEAAADGLVDRAVGLAMLYDDDIAEDRCPDVGCRCVLVRSRLAETLRLLASLRQLLRGTAVWRDGPRLVQDFRFERRPRRYPDRSAVSADELQTEMGGRLGEVGREALRRLLVRADGGALSVSEFQRRSVTAVLDAMESPESRAVMVSAGTGAGKTKAFYLPALMRAAEVLRSDQHRPVIVAVYPRVELLKDQLTEAFREARRLGEHLIATRGRGLTIGALYGDVPNTPNSELRGAWQGPGQTSICPFLRCPDCDGTLMTEDRVHLACSCGFTCGPSEILLDRRSMAETPPDLVFVTGDMLNRVLGHTSYGRIVGVGDVPPPDVLLLDEVHTYQGTSGAQTAMMLRRWTHATRSNRMTFVGLSATLRHADRFLSQLTGVPLERVEDVRVAEEELVEGGQEYLVALRNDASAGTSTLSTTIQTLMLLARCLDDEIPSTEGTFGRKVFAFTDNLDVTNRLYSNLCDAEGRLIWDKPKTGGRPLAQLRGGSAFGGLDDEAERHADGQLWDLPSRLGHDLDAGASLRLGRTNSKDAGLDPHAKVVVATASLEVGLDDEDVGAVVQHGAPRDVAQFLQRKGRAGRQTHMRPWTVVVLSQYGRDRASYAAWDQLLDPELPGRHLPVRNRYVLRMHATTALLDWIALQRPSGLQTSVDLWMLLNGPVKSGQFRKASRSDQVVVADLLEHLLDDEGVQADLAQYLASALRLGSDEVDDLLWHPPRSILLQAVPTLVRQLRTEWHGQIPERGPDASPPPPLAGFIAPNLFSALELPEVEVHAERRDGAHTFEEELPLQRAMREFAPGNVSRRAATDEQSRSHWVPLPDFAPSDRSVQDVEVRDHFPELSRDALLEVPCDEWVCATECGQPHQLEVHRPRSMRVDVTPPPVGVTSRTFARWRSALRPEREGVPLPVPGERTGLESLEFFLHVDRRPVTATRTCVGSDGTGSVDGEEHRYAARFAVDGRIVALGSVTTVDACRLHVTLPEAWAALDGLPLREVRGARAAWLQHRVIQELAPFANRFRAGWLHDALVVSAATAIRSSEVTSLVEAVDVLGDRLPPALLRAVDLLLHRVGDEDLHGSPGRVRDDLAQLVGQPEVIEALRRAVTDDADGPSARSWLAARLQRTWGLAALAAVRDLCPDHDPEGLLLDVVDGELWLTEPDPGGVGFLEEVVRHVEESPRAFARAVRRALEPDDRVAADRALREVVEGLRSGGEFAAAAADYRSAASPMARTAALTALREQLESRAISATHATVASLVGRVLRPGTNTDSDQAIGGLITYLDDVEELLGIQLERRVAGAVAAETPWAYGLVRSVGLVDDEATVIDATEMMLWPMGWTVASAALESWNPFDLEVVPAAPDVLRARLVEHEQPIDAAAENALAEVLTRLSNEGTVRVGCDVADAVRLAEVISHVMAETVDVSVFRSRPRLLDVDRADGVVSATLALPEVVS